jgi:hypothetical protein
MPGRSVDGMSITKKKTPARGRGKVDHRRGTRGSQYE